MSIRFKVEPRDVPDAVAARRLGIELVEFTTRLPALLARGFPYPDPTTGNFDLRAIDTWMDRRSGIGGTSLPSARHAASVVTERLAGLSRG